MNDAKVNVCKGEGRILLNGAKSRTQYQIYKTREQADNKKLLKQCEFLSPFKQFFCLLECFINLVLRARFSANVRNILPLPL